jgi:hypothetical protein
METCCAQNALFLLRPLMTLFEPDIKLRIRSQLFWFFLWLGVTGFAIFLRPSVHGHGTHQQLGLPPCPSVLLFNRPCPGCGLTTSWTATVHGDFLTAFHAHPLGIPMYLGFTLLAFGTAWGNIRGQRLLVDTPKASLFFAIIFTIFFAFGAYRMLTTTNFSSPREQMIRGVMNEK